MPLGLSSRCGEFEVSPLLQTRGVTSHRCTLAKTNDVICELSDRNELSKVDALYKSVP